jgi:hypothetical protein
MWLRNKEFGQFEEWDEDSSAASELTILFGQFHYRLGLDDTF